MTESSCALEEMNMALQSMNVDMAEYLQAANARLGAPQVLAVPAPPVIRPPSDFAAALAAYGQVLLYTVTCTPLHCIRLSRAVSLTLRYSL